MGPQRLIPSDKTFLHMSTEQHVFLKDMKSDVNMTKKIFPVSCYNDVLLLILQLMQGAPLPTDDAHINLLLHKGFI